IPWPNANALGPGLPGGSEFLDAIGLAAREIIRLDSIGCHVVQLPRLIVLGHQLPWAHSHRLVPLVLPEDWLRPLNRLACKRGPKTHTFRFRCVRRGARAGEVEACTHDVDQMAGVLDQSAATIRSDSLWPVNDEGRADTPLVHPVLVFAEWGV